MTQAEAMMKRFMAEVYDIWMERITPEPWLRGTITDAHPVIAQLLYSFQQTREDLEYFTEGLSHDQLWMRPSGLAPVGFHVRHMAGSIDRLLTYARGEQLTPEQMAYLKSEMEPVEGVMLRFGAQLDGFQQQVRSFDDSTLADERKVGRKELPTTVGALLVHIAEHTQRHLGQAIVTAKLVRNEAAS
jgi:uncharacterized damage-inducible protein DinB